MDVADFELRIKEQGARDAAAAMSKLEASLKSAQKAATSFDAAKFWKDELAQIAKVESAQNRIVAFAKRHAGDQQKKSGGGHGIGAAAEAGLIGGLVAGGVEIAASALERLAGAALEGVAAVGHLAFSFAEASAEAAAFAERSKLAIGFLTHDAPGAAQVFDDVRAEAQSLGLGVEDTVHSFQKLLAMQFTVGQSKDLVKLGGDMQAIGADAEHVQRLLYAISEIKGLGTLQQRQVRMLEMAGVSGELINEALAKRLNVTTTEQVKKLQRKGQIDAAVAIDAIEEAVRHKVGESHLGEAGTKFAQTTITGQLNSAKAKAENFFISIGEAITPVEERLLSKGLSLFDRMLASPKLGAFGARILGDLTELADYADANWATITEAFDSGFNSIVDGAETVYGVFKDSALFVAEHWDDIGAGIQEVEINVWNLVAPFIAVKNAIVDLVTWWEKLFAVSDDAGDAIGNALGLNTKFGHDVLGYETNTERKQREANEEAVVSESKARQRESQGLFGIGGRGNPLLPGLTVPGISAPRIPPPDVQNLTGPNGLQSLGSKTVNVGNINVQIDGVDHGGNPAAAADLAANHTRREILRMLETG
jgi:hypothetical protein